MDENVKDLLFEYNLQLFADGGSGEKTEQPTEKKKEKAREEGQVAKSVEVTTALLFIITFSVIKFYGPDLVRKIVELMDELYKLFGLYEMDVNYASGLMEFVIWKLIGIIFPILAAVFVVAIVTNLLQVGWHPSSKPMKPKFSNINPFQGFKRMFSMRSLMELLKALLKIGVILAIVYFSLREYEQLIIDIYTREVLEAYILIADICLDIAIKVGGFFIIIAIIDYIYQRYSLNKKLMMTKQEVKDEYKQQEGNPEIKSKIKQKMREAAMRRMMQDLPNADVIITNPTHFAVAIKYDPNSGESFAPLVIAKGADLVAARIKEVAKENKIEIVENRYLARTLFYTVEIGDEIPPELYQAVAEILALVFSASKSVGNPIG